MLQKLAPYFESGSKLIPDWANQAKLIQTNFGFELGQPLAIFT